MVPHSHGDREVRNRPLLFIVRIQGGWRVKIERKTFFFLRAFMDRDLGGRWRALEAAKLARDAAAARMPPSERAPALPGHGYVRKTRKAGRLAYEGFVWLGRGRHARTQNLIDVWGPRVAKRRCEDWLARHRRALGVGQKQGAR